MDCENRLNQAIDLMADSREGEAEALLTGLIAELKDAMDATPADAERHYYWGRVLCLLDEPEQALLKFEQALHIVPDHEASWWETVSILLWDLDRPESAKTVLEQRLLPLRPGHGPYLEAAASADTLIRRRKIQPPPEAPDEPPAA